MMGRISEGELGDLSRLDDERLAEMFQQRGDDPQFLESLNAELKRRNSDVAFDLHLRVVVARRALVRSQTPVEPRLAAPPSQTAHDWLHAFLGARRLARPDQRPLYRYRMEDSEYEQAKKILRGLAATGRLVEPVKPAGALFVAYCDAVIALADGTILSPGRHVDIGLLRGAVAVSPCRTVLHLGAKGFKSGSIKTVVDGELPLGMLHGAIDETLATLPNQDDLMEIAFIGDSRPSIRISRYRHEQLVRDGTAMRWLATSTHTGAAPVARMILDPRHEHALETRCKGPCLVYLRDGVDVVSRPVPILQPGAPDAYAGVLVSALTKAEYEGRQLAVIDALARLGRGEAEADDLVWLRDAATNLNGLPASALDGLKLLPSSAETLIHLLLCGRDAGERAIIWALQNELPFLWLALPLRAWISAMERQCTALTSTLEAALGREKALKEAVSWLRGVCGDLTALEPAVEIIFAMAGLPTTLMADVPSLRDLTSGYIRDQHQRGGDAPNDLGARLALKGLKLPPEIQEKSHTDFAGLFAPVLLAACAREKLDIDRELSLIARRTLREDPAYASGAWPHLVKFYR
jgi:hypothetical protein